MKPLLKPEALELVVGGLERGQCRSQEIDHLLLARLADTVLVFVGVVDHVVQVMLPDDARTTGPEWRAVTGRVRLADDRDLGAGHRVEPGSLIGRW